MTPRADTDTATRILDVAERLVQVRGFNAFSYADVAAELQITKAALHYHFASKADLGSALVARYTGDFIDALEGIDRTDGSAMQKLEHYAELYCSVLERRRMCLCGMLAAEYQTLPTGMRDSVLAFFDRTEDWLAEVIEQGCDDGSIRAAGSARDTARLVMSCLEGALLVARPYGDADRFDAAASNLLRTLTPAPPTSIRRPAHSAKSRSAASVV
jgi:TetR/AcrR family transcriptional repressor of nem operon